MEFVKVIRKVNIIVEDLKLVRFSVVIEIVSCIDTIPTGDMWNIINNLKAEWLEASRSVTLPSQLFEVFQPGEHPNIPIPS